MLTLELWQNFRTIDGANSDKTASAAQNNNNNKNSRASQNKNDHITIAILD